MGRCVGCEQVSTAEVTNFFELTTVLCERSSACDESGGEIGEGIEYFRAAPEVADSGVAKRYPAEVAKKVEGVEIKKTDSCGVEL